MIMYNLSKGRKIFSKGWRMMRTLLSKKLRKFQFASSLRTSN